MRSRLEPQNKASAVYASIPGKDHPEANQSHQLGEKYRLDEEIGRGQYASIFRALDVEHNRTVALKIFHHRFFADPRFAIRFREHLKAIVDLRNENLASVLDYGVEDEHYYIASEWVDGPDLSTYLSDRGPLSAPQAITITRQLCAAIAAVHGHGLVHRDLKPQNVLIGREGQVKVSDVGLSSLLSESGLSRTNVMLGRVHYISPEQAHGQTAGPESDLYSLGVLLFQMLTNQLPFVSTDAWSVIRMHAEVEPLPPSQVNPRVPPELAEVVLRAMQKDPSKRYASANQMEAALREILDHAILTATKSGDLFTPPRSNWLTRVKAGPLPALTWQLLANPAPSRFFGREVSFGLIVLIQLLLCFLLSLALFYPLSGLILNRAGGPGLNAGFRSPPNEPSTPATLPNSMPKNTPLKTTPEANSTLEPLAGYKTIIQARKLNFPPLVTARELTVFSAIPYLLPLSPTTANL
jgi:serine/threonine protein kinase